MTGLFSFMAQIRLGIGQVNIVDHLIVIARKTTTPLVIEAQESYPPPQPTTRNVVVPAVGDIDPVIYYVDFRESPDGVSLGLLLVQLVYDLKNKVILAEKRYYLVGGLSPNDPAPDQDTLTDSYLDGKTISAVYIDGMGRPLVPPSYAYKEYDLVTGGGIQRLNGQVFSGGEVVVVEISYLGDQTQVSGGGLYNGVVTLTEDTTLNNGHRNKRLRCASNASSRQVHTLEDINAVPDGTFYHFTFNNGNQFQTKILPQAGQVITYYDTTYTEMTLGRGEYLRIEKTGSIWEVTLSHPGVLQVGERFPAGWKDHPNTFPENGALYDGDDWPRPWWWIKNRLPATHYVIDDTLVNVGYTHPAGKEGLFVVHSTLKKFRLPNTQGWGERGLKDFTTYGTDTGRTYDYPGGTQPGSVGDFLATVVGGEGAAVAGGNGGTPNITVLETNIVPPFNGGAKNATNIQVTTGKDTIMKNTGVIYVRRF